MDLAAALRYLRDLGWDVVYRHPAAGASSPAARASGDEAAGASPRTTRNAREGVATPPATSATSLGSAASVLTAPERASALEQLAAEARGCERCDLAQSRTHVVFGCGDPDADLMVIGEGPGAREDRQGLPFVGPAGELLTRILLAIDRPRDRVYIANIVKCRPPQNRDPRPEEVAACRSYLDGQIALVRPRVVVALGRVAAQTLLGSDLPVGRLRGEWWQISGIPLRVTYHPAALLRDPGLKRPTWEDMKIVRDRLGELAPA
ncbi:MAG TPA: uracil-DNA glycosylase [Thermoanaerobaculia bacterium]|nr:uracil-DNA glycosylase [Thermoanaerobaculia bacterium]